MSEGGREGGRERETIVEVFHLDTESIRYFFSEFFASLRAKKAKNYTSHKAVPFLQTVQSVRNPTGVKYL